MFKWLKRKHEPWILSARFRNDAEAWRRKVKIHIHRSLHHKDFVVRYEMKLQVPVPPDSDHEETIAVFTGHARHGNVSTSHLKKDVHRPWELLITKKGVDEDFVGMARLRFAVAA